MASQSSRTLTIDDLDLGSHILIVNEGEEMETRRFRQLINVSRERSYRFVLQCDRNRIGLMEIALRSIEPEDLYLIPLDLNWRSMANEAFDEREFLGDHISYLKAAGYLDRPVVIFVSHANSIVLEPDHLERMMRVEEVRPHWLHLHPCVYACSYMESDEFGSPIPLGRDTLQRMLRLHTHYLGATKNDHPRVLQGKV